ncbi:MAG: transporter substrate binding protein [Candidatus Dependentiae bacterium]|nr:transporter substrate binding protein [Candidatus Dependentiae bacterium]
MSKKVYFLGAVIVLGAVALMAYCWHAGHVVPRRVLFVSASNSAFHEAVRDAFLETAKLRADGKIDVKVVSVPDVVDTTTVFAICEETLTMPADCIVVVGRILSQALVNLARKRKSVVPIVFVGVQSPLELGLVESLERPGGTVTGAVPVPFDDTLPGRLLHVVFPQIKTVLLPFCVPHDAVGEIREKVEKTKKAWRLGEYA